MHSTGAFWRTFATSEGRGLSGGDTLRPPSLPSQAHADAIFPNREPNQSNASSAADGRFLSANDRRATHIKDFPPQAFPPRLAVITFDDGFRDFLTAAWPSLSEFGFTATVFLPTGSIAGQRATFQDRECLTWDEVRTLRREGITFGSHTVSHPSLGGY